MRSTSSWDRLSGGAALPLLAVSLLPLNLLLPLLFLPLALPLLSPKP